MCAPLSLLYVYSTTLLHNTQTAVYDEQGAPSNSLSLSLFLYPHRQKVFLL